MADDIIWVLTEAVHIAHQRQIEQYGGIFGIRDEGLLASALSRPINQLAYGDPPPDLADLGAAYAFGIARNHPFLDGNKRRHLLCC